MPFRRVIYMGPSYDSLPSANAYLASSRLGSAEISPFPSDSAETTRGLGLGRVDFASDRVIDVVLGRDVTVPLGSAAERPKDGKRDDQNTEDRDHPGQAEKGLLGHLFPLRPASKLSGKHASRARE